MTLPNSLAAFGPVMQLSYCPRDYDAVLARWIAIGAGPFFERQRVPLDDLRYRGAPADIDMTIALGNLGDLQIEIIRQNNDVPSMFTEWHAAGHEGVQHVCVLIDDIADVRARVAAAGFTVVQEGRVPNGGGEVIYVETGGGPGTIMEYFQPGAAPLERFAMIREAHRNWDGSAPIRRSA